MDDATLAKVMPNRMKHLLAEKHAKFYVIDANKLAAQIGMGRHTNTTFQAAFFYLSQQIMPYKDAETWMKHFAEKSYAKKGQAVVDLNYKAIDAGPAGLREVKVDPAWVKLPVKKVANKVDSEDTYFDDYVDTIDKLDGDELPTSEFLKYELADGTMEPNITFRQHRAIADMVPEWNPAFCIECNQCCLRLPARHHPSVLDQRGGVEERPGIVKTALKDPIPLLPAAKGLKFRIQVFDELRRMRPLRFRMLRQQSQLWPKIRRARTSLSRWSKPRANSPNKMARIISTSTPLTRVASIRLTPSRALAS
jgi:pyruvate-ferredoxin/flavodoxin oxidoreductase